MGVAVWSVCCAFVRRIALTVVGCVKLRQTATACCGLRQVVVAAVGRRRLLRTVVNWRASVIPARVTGAMLLAWVRGALRSCMDVGVSRFFGAGGRCTNSLRER